MFYSNVGRNPSLTRNAHVTKQTHATWSLLLEFSQPYLEEEPYCIHKNNQRGGQENEPEPQIKGVRLESGLV